ncbi:3'-5' exonuclease KapD [Staphylospora marina]|uniref:3'-5' exonuclease KapD n=1 Tax=Staphylospora marina TaxID=2490858 RepID=UPI000F5BDD5F|nr:3'-5' exonuclease KapD [Staphylospora marina]
MPEAGENARGFFAEIIEAGVVSVRNGQREASFGTFVRPEVNPVLTERCKEFLGITQEDVDGGIAFADLLKRLREWTGPDTRVVTWGNMDLHVLRKMCERVEESFPFHDDGIDLSMEYKRFYGDRNQTGLMKALSLYGRECDRRHHRALDDAMTTFEIFQLLEKDRSWLTKPEGNRIGDLIDLSKLKEGLA